MGKTHIPLDLRCPATETAHPQNRARWHQLSWLEYIQCLWWFDCYHQNEKVQKYNLKRPCDCEDCPHVLRRKMDHPYPSNWKKTLLKPPQARVPWPSNFKATVPCHLPQLPSQLWTAETSLGPYRWTEQSRNPIDLTKRTLLRGPSGWEHRRQIAV